jgi:sugar lactone lactonase YvrE
MTTHVATPASPIRHVLGEGPRWNAERQTLLWVDIEAGNVFEGCFDQGSVVITRELSFPETVGVAVPGPDNTLLVALEKTLVVVDENNAVSIGPQIIDTSRNSRLNDGACDPRGQFLVGTLCLSGPSREEFLVRVAGNGTPEVIDDDLTLSNGLAWSPDEKILYSTDSLRQTIFARDYDADTGYVGERRIFLEFSEGLPDGICVDLDGFVWVALWGLGEVRSFSPRGDVGDVVTIDAPHPSSVTFAGPNLETLVITTASVELTKDERTTYPDAGRIFLADVGKRGLASAAWSGAVGS